MAPEEPTSAPVMISIGLWSVKPMPAAAQPEYELSIEITTGMSAPPIGMIRRKPIAKASSVISANAMGLAPATKMIKRMTIRTAVPPLIR
jgi:hypothetical protein